MLEVSFSDKVHTNSVAFHVDVGKVPMSRQNQETGEDPQVPPEFRNMRPTTPDRKRKLDPTPQAQKEKPKRRRKSRWDEPTGSAGDALTSSTPKFVLAFSPPPGLTKILTQLIRLLNPIQSQFPVTLDTLNFVVLYGDEDPMFFFGNVTDFGNVTGFGNVLSRFSRESILAVIGPLHLRMLNVMTRRPTSS